jgi:hypothetical protein
MNTEQKILFLFLALMVAIPGICSAEEPVKWSAPMTHYPSQWSPTPAPQNYYNPYGYQYYYDPYGFGAGGQYGGSYQGGPQNYQYPNGAFSGNPYNY